jgi:hypothetical protein
MINKTFFGLTNKILVLILPDGEVGLRVAGLRCDLVELKSLVVSTFWSRPIVLGMTRNIGEKWC